LFLVHLQQEQMKESKLRVYVRRGGPNWEQGLAKMRALSKEIGVPIEVYISLLFPSSLSFLDVLTELSHFDVLILGFI
jgi:hypothetical protein